MSEKPSKKDQIIDIASRLFFEQGYNATGIKQIIEAADIAKGTFYSHFKSKEELALEWLRRGNESWVAEREAFIEKAGPDPEARLLALFDMLAKEALDCNYRGCAFLNTIAESPDIACPMRHEIQRYKQDFLDRIYGLVKQCLPESSEKDVEQRAGVIYLLFEGSTVAAQSFCKTRPIELAKRQVSAILAS